MRKGEKNKKTKRGNSRSQHQSTLSKIHHLTFSFYEVFFLLRTPKLVENVGSCYWFCQYCAVLIFVELFFTLQANSINYRSFGD